MAANYPFTAIAGQDALKRALLLATILPSIGGVLIRGERGTAKTTAVRALPDLLPEIEVIAGCRYGCDPGRPDDYCDGCRSLTERTVEHRPIRLVDLPVSATEDRVAGSLDLERAIRAGERAFFPGLLADAHRGILYVDEVNLLDDHLVDLLLDVAASGVNVVQREGIALRHPAQILLVGTMNPEEGELRPQLLDRFGLCVDVRGLTSTAGRVEVLERQLTFEENPAAFRLAWQQQQRKLARKVVDARRLVQTIQPSRLTLAAVATLTQGLELEGHRADLVIIRAARANAAFEGRTTINSADVLLAARLAIPHRLREPAPGVAPTGLDGLPERLQAAEDDAAAFVAASEPSGNAADSPDDDPQDGSGTAAPLRGGKQSPPGTQNTEHGRPSAEARPALPPVIQASAQRASRARGKRSRARASSRGRMIGARSARPGFTALALGPTIRAAAPHQIHRPGKLALAIAHDDLHEPVRTSRQGTLILFVVDASWSTALGDRMAAAKGAVLALLADAYLQRDLVSLIVFRGSEATLVLPPTSAIRRTRRALANIAVGGKTPLAAGLALAYAVVRRFRLTHPNTPPIVMLLSDGLGNVPNSALPPDEEARRWCLGLRALGTSGLVVHTGKDGGQSQLLAEWLDGRWLALDQLAAGTLTRAARRARGT